MIFEFGKHRGKHIRDVPEAYLLWLIKQRQEDIEVYQRELDRREAEVEASQDMVAKLIKSGYRELSKRLHPDCGGTTAEFQELQAAFEKLKSLYM